MFNLDQMKTSLKSILIILAVVLTEIVISVVYVVWTFWAAGYLLYLQHENLTLLLCKVGVMLS